MILNKTEFEVTYINHYLYQQHVAKVLKRLTTS